MQNRIQHEDYRFAIVCRNGWQIQAFKEGTKRARLLFLRNEMSTPEKESFLTRQQRHCTFQIISIFAPFLGIVLGLFLPDAYEPNGHPPLFLPQGPIVGLFLGSLLGTLSGLMGITSAKWSLFICLFLNLALALLSGSTALKILPAILNKVLFL